MEQLWKFMDCRNGRIAVKAEDKRQGAKIDEKYGWNKSAYAYGNFWKRRYAVNGSNVGSASQNDTDVAKEKEEIPSFLKVKRVYDEEKENNPY